jgi:hypothetical protein
MNNTTTAASIGFGNALAMVISFHENNHIGWAILHGIFGWFYVLYAYLFEFDKEI